MNLDPFQPQKPLTARQLNAVVKAINTEIPVTSGPGLQSTTTGSGRIIRLADSLPGQSQFKFGVVVDAGPASEADYTDYHYWVKIQVNSTDSTTLEQSSAITPVDLTTPDSSPYAMIVTVINISELSSGAHKVPVGQPVQVWTQDLDQPTDDSPTQPRYWMEFAGLTCTGSGTTTLSGGVSGSDDSNTWDPTVGTSALLTVQVGAYYDSSTGVLSILTRNLTIGACGLITNISAVGRTTVTTAETCS